MPRPRKPVSPFRYFNSSPEVIRLVVMMYVRFPLSLRNVEDLLFERGIDICHEGGVRRTGHGRQCGQTSLRRRYASQIPSPSSEPVPPVQFLA
jgi:transposase-like protein